MSKSPSSHRARRMTGVCALVVALLMLVWQAAALAGPGSGSTGQQTDPGTAEEAPAPAEDTEASAPAAETEPKPAVVKGSKATAAQEEAPEEEATGGASATSSVVDLEVAGGDLVVVSESNSEASDEGCSARATPLFLIVVAIGEQTSECAEGQDTVSEGDIGLAGVTCGSPLCLAVLYGYAQSTDSAESTESNSQSDIVSVCLSSEPQESPRDRCTSDQSIGARVGHSRSRATRNKKTGEAGAEQESSLVEVCLGGEDPETGICNGVGIIILHSEGSAIARPGQTAEVGGSSSTVILEATGENQGSFSENVAVPPGCDDVPDEERPGALCVALNDGDVNAEAGKGSGHQEAISLDAITVIGGSIDQGDVSADSTKVKGEKVSPPKPPKPPKPDKKKPLAGPAGPALANTGASPVPTLFFAFGLMVLGLRLVRTPAPVRR